ncbi:MAG: hypothetical protein Q4B68_06690 [Bacteroidales bacterium]|nr:hypothetical protein [Bacteroidales bacterium]
MKRITAFIAAAAICIGFSAQAQMYTLRQVLSPITDLLLCEGDGYFLGVYDLHHAPCKSIKEMHDVKGTPDMMVQKTVLKQGFGDLQPGTYIYAAKYNEAGLPRTIIDQSAREEKLHIIYNQNRIKAMGLMKKVETRWGTEDRADVTHYFYNAAGKLTKEVYNMKTLDGKGDWQREPSFTNDVDWEYLYNGNGQLSSAKPKHNNGLVHYNSQGLISSIDKDGITAYKYAYDANGQLASVTALIVDDGPEGCDYYRLTTTFTRDAKGNIVKAVKQRDICNDNFKVLRKGSTKTYAIAYTYDAKANWTKAVITRGKALIGTITRKFTY